MQLVQLNATWAYASKYLYHSTSTVSSATRLLILHELAITRLMNRWRLFVQHELRISIRDCSAHCEDVSLRDEPNFFWSDPIFSTRFSVRRGLTRTDLSLYTRIDCARKQLDFLAPMCSRNSADIFAPTSRETRSRSSQSPKKLPTFYETRTFIMSTRRGEVQGSL